MADIIRPRDDGTYQEYSPAGARDPHAGDGRAPQSTARLYVVDTRYPRVHDANVDRAEERWISDLSLADQPPHAVHLSADAC